MYTTLHCIGNDKENAADLFMHNNNKYYFSSATEVNIVHVRYLAPTYYTLERLNYTSDDILPAMYKAWVADANILPVNKGPH